MHSPRSWQPMDTTVLNLSSSLAPVVALAEARNVDCKLFWNARWGTYLNTMGVMAFCLGWPVEQKTKTKSWGRPLNTAGKLHQHECKAWPFPRTACHGGGVSGMPTEGSGATLRATGYRIRSSCVALGVFSRRFHSLLSSKLLWSSRERY